MHRVSIIFLGIISFLIAISMVSTLASLIRTSEPEITQADLQTITTNCFSFQALKTSKVEVNDGFSRCSVEIIFDDDENKSVEVSSTLLNLNLDTTPEFFYGEEEKVMIDGKPARKFTSTSDHLDYFVNIDTLNYRRDPSNDSDYNNLIVSLRIETSDVESKKEAELMVETWKWAESE